MRKIPPFLLNNAARSTIAATAILLSGCFSTHLGEYVPPTELDKLVDSAETHIPLHITNPLSDSSQGYQYLLVALPISRVFPDDLASLVRDKLTLYAGLSRYGLTKPTSTQPTLPRLKVVVEDVSVNGYDMLVVRRPSASITISATLHTADGKIRECLTSGRASEYTRFAFSPDLTQVLEHATDSAAQQMIACLGLSAPGETYYQAIKPDTSTPAPFVRSE